MKSSDLDSVDARLLTLVLNYVVFIYLLQVNFLKFSQFSLDAFLA